MKLKFTKGLIKNTILLCILSFTVLLSCKEEDEITPDSENIPHQDANPLFLIKQGGKFGFINKEGAVVIPAIYDRTKGFSEELASVELNGNSGFIDKNGVLKLNLPYKYVTNFFDGMAKVSMGTNNKHGYIDKTGRLVIDIKYEGHYFFSEGFVSVYSFDMSKYVFLNKEGKVAFNRGFNNADNFSDGLAFVNVDQNTNSFIDTNGNIITCVPCNEADPYYDNSRFSEGLMPIAKWVNNKRFVGFVDKQGKLVIPFNFQDALPFSEGLAAVLKEGQGWGFIDKNGTTVIPLIYQGIADRSGNGLGEDEDGGRGKGFSDGLASVRLNNKYGYIDKSGKMVIPNIFDDAFDFTNGLAAVFQFNKGMGYINKSGLYVWNPTK